MIVKVEGIYCELGHRIPLKALLPGDEEDEDEGDEDDEWEEDEEDEEDDDEDYEEE